MWFTVTLATILTAVILSQQTDCIATTVYHESRGEPYAGQVAVALVVRNRTLSDQFPNIPCEVMKQPRQFAFVTNGLHLQEPENEDAWDIAMQIAVDVMNIPVHTYERPMQNSVYFHSGAYPGWNENLIEQTVRIGEHKFYRNKES